MTEAGKQELKHVEAGQTPKCGVWKVLTLEWLDGDLGVCCNMGLRRRDFPVGVC